MIGDWGSAIAKWGVRNGDLDLKSASEGSISCVGCKWQDLDQVREGKEVSGVVGEEFRNSVGKHRCHDVGVVNAFAAYGKLLHEFEKTLRDGWPVFSQAEGSLKVTRLVNDGARWKGGRERLRTGKCGDELAQDLPADPASRWSGGTFLYGSTRRRVKRPILDDGVNEHVGVKKNAVSVRRRHTCPRVLERLQRAIPPRGRSANLEVDRAGPCFPLPRLQSRCGVPQARYPAGTEGKPSALHRRELDTPMSSRFDLHYSRAISRKKYTLSILTGEDDAISLIADSRHESAVAMAKDWSACLFAHEFLRAFLLFYPSQHVIEKG